MRSAEERGGGGGTQEPFHFVTLRVQSGWGGRGEVGVGEVGGGGGGGCIEQGRKCMCFCGEFAGETHRPL